MWSVVRGSAPVSWAELKKAVEDRFGLPRKALIDAFYSMEVAPG